MPEQKAPVPEESKMDTSAGLDEKDKRANEFGFAYTEQLAKIDEIVDSLRPLADKDPDIKPALELAEKRKELFLSEHDQAGAFKFKRLGREIQGYFDGREGEKVIEVDKDGRMNLAESQKDRRLLFVNMGELDRFNKEAGSHIAADEALKSTARAIERVVREKLKGKETKYELFRYSGNEYSVSFENISEEDLAEIAEAVQKERPTVGDLEPAPLVAETMDFQEVLDIINQMQTELDPDERIDTADPIAAGREIMEVMKRRANYSLDVDKFRSRVGRVKGMIAEKGDETAQKFYDNYMAKLFRTTELNTLDAFKDVGDKDVERMAFEFASKMLGESRATEDATRLIIDARIREIREARAEGAAPPKYDRAVAADPGRVNPRLAEIPELTEGQKELQKAEARMRQAKADAERPDSEALADVLAELDYDIEAARRDKGTGLLERGVHYESLQKAFEKDKEGNAKDVSMAFIDMGFLKYFDNKGGSEVGDAALKMAASVIEKAIVTAGVKGEAFRYGGDEFTVQVEGGPDELKKFTEALDAERRAAGAIPQGKRGDRDGYYPTELVFNIGSADTRTANDIFEGLKAQGRFSDEELAVPGREANIKAEIMTLLADKGVEAEKAVERFMLLADMLRDEGYREVDGKPTERKVQIDSMISFSNKAIFAEKGGGEFLKRLAESGMDPLAMRAEVSQWVEKAMQEAGAKETKKKEMLDQLVEMHAKIAYFEREMGKLKAETDEQKAEIARLKTEKAQIEKDRASLLTVRKSLEDLDKAA